MITLNVWDAQGIYSHSVEADPLGALPERSTPQGLPELQGGQVARWTGGGWEVLSERPAISDVTVSAIQHELTQANNAAYEGAIGALTADYPPAEIQTWERQRAEAIAWQADPAAATPWIDVAAAVRQLDRAEYLARTAAKVHAFAAASAYLTGRRQGIDDAIRTATTPLQLASIVIDYTLPAGGAHAI